MVSGATLTSRALGLAAAACIEQTEAAKEKDTGLFQNSGWTFQAAINVF
ncbi:MAG: hypothetical protein LBD48_02185 [Treponema sp.]|jgi:hypothetical protein|nr:hypothetical protein [Treponema sp.]